MMKLSLSDAWIRSPKKYFEKHILEYNLFIFQAISIQFIYIYNDVLLFILKLHCINFEPLAKSHCLLKQIITTALVCGK